MYLLDASHIEKSMVVFTWRKQGLNDFFFPLQQAYIKAQRLFSPQAVNVLMWHHFWPHSCLSPLIPQHFNVLIQHIILPYQSAKPAQVSLAMIAFNLLLITITLCFIL